jgi:hypothetical protein
MVGSQALNLVSNRRQVLKARSNFPETLVTSYRLKPPQRGMATNTPYKCSSQAAPDPSPYLRESGDSVVDACHMCEPQPSYPRKRPRPEDPPLYEISRPVLKKQRVSHPSGSHPPPEFWDNLSKICLTKHALRELDRRNARAARRPRSRYPRLHRPVTRGALAEWTKREENWQPTRPADGSVTYCTPSRLGDIQLFARRGGPDLSDLRGVCITR